MNLLAPLFRSSLGKKYVMAVTGAGLLLFVISHMLGNLQIYLGQEAINAYAAFLHSMPELLWTARLGLLGAVVLHIYCAVRLTLENRAARPATYAQGIPYQASYAARTMIWSGPIILAFVLYHLAHFTCGWVDSSFLELHDAQGRHDVFHKVVHGFSKPLVSGFYIFAMAVLCLHLSHGVSSLFQSLGLKNRHWGPWIDRFAWGAATVIFVGNSSIPLAILLGYGR